MVGLVFIMHPMITRLSSDLRTKAHANADGLSRLPLPTDSEGKCLSDVSLYNVSQIETISVSVVDLCKATRSDPLLSKVFLFTKGVAFKMS